MHGIDLLNGVPFALKHVSYQELGRDGRVGVRVDGHVPVPEPIELDLSVVLLGLNGVGERGAEEGFEWSVDGGDIERGRRKGQRREENIGQNTSIWRHEFSKPPPLPHASHQLNYPEPLPCPRA